jgi:thiamine transporter ThiT
VNAADATPEALVATVIVAVLLLNTPEAPEPGAVNVTFTPETGLLLASFTVTARAFANAVLMATDCGVVPAFAVIEAGAPALLVSEKFTVVSPVAAAVTVYGPPAVAFAVSGAEATPEALVVTVIVAVLLLNTPEAPEPGAVNVTFMPETGLLPASFTVTASALANAVLIVADCGVVPAFAVIVVAGPAVLLSEKFTVVRPAEAAETVYGPPTVAFEVNGAEATPDAFVATVIVAVLLLNTPEAPEPGAVNVTFTPETGLLAASFTVTASGLAKAVMMAADCGVVPAFAVIDEGDPAVLVSEKFTVGTPAAVAVTVYGPPDVAFAVNGAEATPEALVARLIVAVLLLNSPEAPEPGAVNVTFTPEMGLLLASLTVTARALAKAVLTVADCGVVPVFAVMEAAAPAVLVSEKFTVVSPVAAAVTV